MCWKVDTIRVPAENLYTSIYIYPNKFQFRAEALKISLAEEAGETCYNRTDTQSYADTH